MTIVEKLAAVKTMLGIDNTSEDALLTVYLNSAGDRILRKAYPYDTEKTEVPERYDYIQCDIAVYLYNKQGAEGQIHHNEGGIVRVYENADVPESLLRWVIPFAEVI